MTKKSIIETKTFVEGDIIYSHNDLSNFIYLIVSGEVKVFEIDLEACLKTRLSDP